MKRSLVIFVAVGFLALSPTLEPPPARAADAVVKFSAVAPTVTSQQRLVHIPLMETTAIAAQKGWLQEEFARYNAKADLVATSTYGGGATVASLFERGDLHIVSLMMNMSLQYRAQGFDSVVIWGSGVVNPKRAQTIVLADSPMSSIQALKGHTMGASLLSCPYYASMEALRRGSVTVDNDFGAGDLRFVNISGAAATSAFLSGRFDVFAVHPASSTTAALFIQNQVKTITSAIPDGIYVNSGGRSMQFAARRWANENPDLVKAYLTSYDRVVRWLASDNGTHLDEAARITSRALRVSKPIALFALKDQSATAWNWGETNADVLIANMKKFQAYQLSVKDPTFTRNHLTERQIEELVDRRFFAGGSHFVDVSPKKGSSSQAEGGLKRRADELAATR